MGEGLAKEVGPVFQAEPQHAAMDEVKASILAAVIEL